jgi:hypothetical protein
MIDDGTPGSFGVSETEGLSDIRGRCVPIYTHVDIKADPECASCVQWDAMGGKNAFRSTLQRFKPPPVASTPGPGEALPLLALSI